MVDIHSYPEDVVCILPYILYCIHVNFFSLQVGLSKLIILSSVFILSSQVQVNLIFKKKKKKHSEYCFRCKTTYLNESLFTGLIFIIKVKINIGDMGHCL